MDLVRLTYEWHAHAVHVYTVQQVVGRVEPEHMASEAVRVCFVLQRHQPSMGYR